MALPFLHDKLIYHDAAFSEELTLTSAYNRRPIAARRHHICTIAASHYDTRWRSDSIEIRSGNGDLIRTALRRDCCSRAGVLILERGYSLPELRACMR
jgi:hypothetical protein